MRWHSTGYKLANDGRVRQQLAGSALQIVLATNDTQFADLKSDAKKQLRLLKELENPPSMDAAPQLSQMDNSSAGLQHTTSQASA